MFDELLRRNREYATRFAGGELPPQPAKQLAVLTCMDSRIEPWATFGLRRGEAHVLRNAGARVTDDVVRSLLFSVHVLDVRAVAVVGHTGCGLVAYTNDEVRSRVRERTGLDVSSYDFLPVPDEASGVRDGLRRLRAEPLFAGVEVAGFVFDLATGLLAPVDET